MSSLLLFPVKFLGFAALGFALGAGWKLGSYLVDVALDEETRDHFFECTNLGQGSTEQPIWKRSYPKVSEP
jgi:hypothetical protein